MFRDSSGLRKVLGSLPVDDWGCVPTLLIVWPEASQHWSLQSLEWGQVWVTKGQPPGELMSVNISQYFHHWYPCPYSEPQLPLPSGAPLRPAGKSGPGFYQIIAFSLGPTACEILCVPFKIQSLSSQAGLKLNLEKNYNYGIQSYYFMANRRGKSSSSDGFYFGAFQNHC